MPARFTHTQKEKKDLVIFAALNEADVILFKSSPLVPFALSPCLPPLVLHRIISHLLFP